MEHLANYLGAYMSAGSLLVTFFAKGNPHWSKINLAVGVILVGIASLSFATLTNFSMILDVMLKNGDIDKVTHYLSKDSATVWVFILPAVTAAVGANILSAWFLAERPKK